jgi:Autographiviridae terminase large subunit
MIETADKLRDFRTAVTLIWRYLSDQDPKKWGVGKPSRLQLDAAKFLQYGGARIAVIAFREFAKTTETAGYGSWRLDRDVNTRVLIVSGAEEFASWISGFIWQLIHEVEWLEHLRPGSDDLTSRTAFEVAGAAPGKDPSVASVGIFGHLPGRRPDVLIADDVETEKNTETVRLREKLASRVLEFERMAQSVTGQVIYLGTPQTEESIYNGLEDRGYTVRLYPQRYPNLAMFGGNSDRYEHFMRLLAPILQVDLKRDPSLAMGGGIEGQYGKPTDPERFDEAKCQLLELRYGRRGYRLHALLDTHLEDEERYPLKLRDLMVMDLDVEMGPRKLTYRRDDSRVVDIPVIGFRGDRYYAPDTVGELQRYNSTILVLDPAGKRVGGDRTGWLALSELNSSFFAHDWGGLPGGYGDDVMEEIADKAIRFRCDAALIEKNYGHGALGHTLRPFLERACLEAPKRYPHLYNDRWHCGIIDVTNSGVKENRLVDTLEPVISGHRLVLQRSALEREARQSDGRIEYTAAFQLSHLIRQPGALPHDDIVEVFEMGVRHFKATLALDVDQQIASRSSDDARADLREQLRFHGRQDIFGPEPDGNWLDWLKPLRQRTPIA